MAGRLKPGSLFIPFLPTSVSYPSTTWSIPRSFHNCHSVIIDLSTILRINGIQLSFSHRMTSRYLTLRTRVSGRSNNLDALKSFIFMLVLILKISKYNGTSINRNSREEHFPSNIGSLNYKGNSKKYLSIKVQITGLFNKLHLIPATHLNFLKESAH